MAPAWICSLMRPVTFFLGANVGSFFLAGNRRTGAYAGQGDDRGAAIGVRARKRDVRIHKTKSLAVNPPLNPVFTGIR